MPPQPATDTGPADKFGKPLWFVEIRDLYTDDVTRYIPVHAYSQGGATTAAASVINRNLERIGTIAARQHFVNLGVKDLPPDSAAINAASIVDTENGDANGDANGIFDPSGALDISADTDPALRREAFEFGPGFEAGLRQRGIDIGPGGGLQGAIAQSRQRALEDRFFTQEALRKGGTPLTSETADPTFQRFLSATTPGATAGGGTFTNPLFGQAGAQAARGLLNTARGFGAPASQALPSALAGSVLNPATVGQGQTLANVAREAGRQRFGSLSRFLPNAEALSQSFLSQDRPMPGTFADYLNTRIFG